MNTYVRFKKLNQSGFDHVFMAVACFVIVGVVGTAMLVASHAQTSQWTGVLRAFGQNSKYCLTATSGTAGSEVVINPCSTAKNVNQIWTVKSIKKASVLGAKNVQVVSVQSTAGTNMCLDNTSKSMQKSYPETLSTCSDTDTGAQWVWGVKLKSRGYSAHQLANIATVSGNKALCLDVQKGGRKPNTLVGQYSCKTSGQANQNWFEAKAPTTTTPTPKPTPTPTPTPTPSPSPSPNPTPTSSISCDYQVDTWSGDASGVGYTASKVSSKDGNPASFSVKLNAKKGTTEVVGYPSDECLLYSALPANLTSSYNITPPASSQGLDYEYAYDIWLTTSSAANANNWNKDLELMIWNYTAGQVPAGNVKTTLSDGSKVWIDGNNTTGIVSVVRPQNTTTGTVNISSLVAQLKSLGYVSNTYDGILDVEYGIEAPYGGGQTFTVNSMSVAE